MQIFMWYAVICTIVFYLHLTWELIPKAFEQHPATNVQYPNLTALLLTIVLFITVWPLYLVLTPFVLAEQFQK